MKYGKERAFFHSSQDLFDNVTMDIGKAAFEAIVVIGQAFVIETEEVEDGGVEVVDGGDVFSGFVAEVIGGSVGVGGFDSGSHEPGGEAVGVMVPAGGTFLESGHAAKLGGPDNECVFEETSAFHVLEEGGTGLVENGAMFAVLCFDLFVSVPITDTFATGLVGTVEELDKANAFFEEAAGKDTVFGKAGFELVLGIIGSVFLENAVGFGGKIGDLGNAELHPGGKFITGNSGSEFRVSGELGQVAFVDAFEEASGRLIGLGSGAFGNGKIAERFAGIELRPLIGGRQEAGAPIVDTGLGSAPRIGNGHIGGQVFAFCTKCPCRPGSHTGKAIESVTGGHEVLSRAVGIGLARHGMNEAHVVGQFG